MNPNPPKAGPWVVAGVLLLAVVAVLLAGAVYLQMSAMADGQPSKAEMQGALLRAMDESGEYEEFFADGSAPRRFLAGGWVNWEYQRTWQGSSLELRADGNILASMTASKRDVAFNLPGLREFAADLPRSFQLEKEAAAKEMESKAGKR